MVYRWFYFRENYTFPRFQGGGGGSNIFQRIPTFSSGGPKANFYRNPYNL